MIALDISTKIIDPKTNIWVIFPGRGRRFHGDFQSQEAIFLETPGLNLSAAAAGNMKAIRQHVRMSSAWQEYYRSNRTVSPPSRNPQTYDDGVLSEGRMTVLASNVRKLFDRVKVGDLVIVPGKSIFDAVMFGEVLTDFAPSDHLQVPRYPLEEIQFRRVKWINRSIPRTQIPVHLQIYLSKPPAIAQVSRVPETDEFFRLAYPAVVLADRSAIILEGPRYDGKHPMATQEANELVTYLMAAYNAIELDKLKEFADLDIRAAINKYFDPALVVEYSQNFNSPGRFGLIAASAVLGTFVTLGVSVAILSIPSSDLRSDVFVTNSVSPSDKAIASDAGTKLNYFLKSLSSDRISEMQRLGAESKQKIDLKTPVVVIDTQP